MRKLNLILVLSMIFSLCFSDKIFAGELQKEATDSETVSALIAEIDFEEEFERARNHISDIPITEEILESCEATITDSEGKIETADISVTVRKIGKISRSNDEKGTVYSLSAFATKAKQKTDSGQTGTVDHTYAYGNLVWIDNLGLGNELVSVSGGWSTSSTDKLANRYVGYGVSFGSGDTYLEKYPTGNNFSYSSNGKMKALFVCLDTSVTVNGEGLCLRVVNLPTT